MTTPAQDAPLVFPSVAFRPVRLLVIAVVLTALATAAAAFVGKPWFGVFFGLGLGLGLVNAILVERSVEAITAQDHPLKKKMAMNSAGRLLVITVIALGIAFAFRPTGLGVMFGLALFQALLVLTTALPVLQKLRRTGAEPSATSSTGAGAGTSTEDLAAEG